MDSVKSILLKAKNQMILAVSAAAAAFVGDVKVMAEQFSTDLDVNVFKGTLENRANDLNLSADLYPAQAEFELTEMVNGIVAEYEAKLSALKADMTNMSESIEELTAQLANAATEKDQLMADFTAKFEDKDIELELAQNEITALAGEVATIRKQRDSFKLQYEAAIADEGVTLALDKGSDQYTPPAAASDTEDSEKATDDYAAAALAWKRIKRKQSQ